MMIEVEIGKSGKKDKKLVAKFQFPDIQYFLLELSRNQSMSNYVPAQINSNISASLSESG
jgi:hypothetical protein